MVALRRVGTTVEVRPTRAEKVLGLFPDLDIPLTAVVGMEVVRDPLRTVRGFRLGLDLPGVRKMGRWSWNGELSLVSVRRGQPAVQVHLTGRHFRTLLIGSDDAEELATGLLQLT
jgi:hypothetical protein